MGYNFTEVQENEELFRRSGNKFDVTSVLVAYITGDATWKQMIDENFGTVIPNLLKFVRGG
jgi:hypothetical protein